MKRRYMKGSEVISKGIFSAQELGELCDKGEVTAWLEPGTHQYSTGEQWQCGCPSRSTIPFPFNFEIYAKENGGHISDIVTASQYAEDLGRMWFLIAEINNASGEDVNIIKKDEEYEQNDDALIPRYLWCMPDLYDVVYTMKAKGFADDAIAFVLKKRDSKMSLTEIGKMIYSGQRESDSSYQKLAKVLLENPSRKWRVE